MKLKKFSSPSKIDFGNVEPGQGYQLQQTSRGDTFMFKGAVCMRVENCHDASDRPWVMNLQTGRTWVGDAYESVTPVKIKATVTALAGCAS